MIVQTKNLRCILIVFPTFRYLFMTLLKASTSLLAYAMGIYTTKISSSLRPLLCFVSLITLHYNLNTLSKPKIYNFFSNLDCPHFKMLGRTSTQAQPEPTRIQVQKQNKYLFQAKILPAQEVLWFNLCNKN